MDFDTPVPLPSPGARWIRALKALLLRPLRDDGFLQTRAFLKTVTLFRRLSKRDLGVLAHRMVEKNYASGDAVFQEGDIGRACFVVREGRVEISRQGMYLATLGPGDFFGEMVLLDELPRSASARCLSPARLMILYKTHFDSLTLQSPQAAAPVLHALARLLSARLRRQNAEAPSAQAVSSA